MKKEIKLTDALFNQQIGEKGVAPPIITWQERCVTGDIAGSVMILREDNCGSWWPLRLD